MQFMSGHSGATPLPSRLFVLIFVLIEQWQWSYIVIKPFHQSFGIWFSRPDIVSSSVMNEPLMPHLLDSK
jgi:hypothetical protein